MSEPKAAAKKVRAALYARVSTKDKGQDPSNQLIPLREKAAQRGWTVTREFIEFESASGKVRRSQYADMLRAADQREYDVLAFWSLDRFSREGVVQTLLDLRRLTAAGVLWVSLQDPIPDEPGPLRDMVVSIMASLAQLESQRRSERAKAAVTRLRAEGKSVGRKRRNVPLKAILELQDKGFSLSAIARHLKLSRATIYRRLEEVGQTTNKYEQPDDGHE